MSGFAGRAGKPGPQGPAGTITLAPTVVGQPGSDPSVRNVGGVSEAILEFTLSTGARGEQGPIGPQALFGTPAASTLPAGSQATAAISGAGTEQSPYILSLGIPAGEQGVQGETGATGATGPQPVFGSPVANTLPAGSAATATISGLGTDASPYILTLGLPRGAQGVQGDQPIFGTPNVSTLEPGVAATVSISGSGTVADPYILSFGIPKGAKGDTGATGEPGALTEGRDPTSSDGTAVGQVFTNSVTKSVFVLTALNPNTWLKICYPATAVAPAEGGYTTGAQINAERAQPIPYASKGGADNQFVSGSVVILTDLVTTVPITGYAIVDAVINWNGSVGDQKLSVSIVRTSGNTVTYFGVGTTVAGHANENYAYAFSRPVYVEAGDVLKLAVTTWASGGATVLKDTTYIEGIVMPAYAQSSKGPRVDSGTPVEAYGPPDESSR